MRGDKERDQELQEIEEEMDGDFDYAGRGGRIRSGSNWSNGTSPMLKPIMLAAGVLVLIVVLVLVFAGRGGKNDTSYTATRLDMLEARLEGLETQTNGKLVELEERLAAAEQGHKTLAGDFAQLEISQRELGSHVQAVTRQLQSEVRQLATSPPAAPAPSSKPARPQESARYHTVQKGDTLYSISRKYDLSVERLRQLNDLSQNVIQPGQKLKVGQ